MTVVGLGFADSIPRILYILVYLAGLIVAAILAVRHKSTPAILALIAFIVLFVVGLAGFARNWMVVTIAQAIADPSGFAWATGGVGCCCGSIDVAAFVLLIVALWKAIAGGGRRKARKGETAPGPEPAARPATSEPEPETAATAPSPEPVPAIVPDAPQGPAETEQTTRKFGAPG